MRSTVLSLCVFLLLGLAGCGGGGASSSTQAESTPPTVRIIASGQVAIQGASPNLVGSVGADISLSGATSADDDGDLLVFKWDLISKPANSTLVLTSDKTAVTTFTPDVLGTYEFRLRVTDIRGAFADKNVSILVNNTAPLATVVISTSFTAISTVTPTRTISIGDSVLLDASASTNPQNNPISIAWTLTDKPTASAAVLLTNLKTARFTADVQGIYKVKVRAQDSLGAASETIYVLDAQNAVPNAVLLASAIPVQANSGQSSFNASVGYDILLDGASSSDPNGDLLTRTWQLVSKPSGSSVLLNTTAGMSSQFSPDVLGNYVVVLTVADPSGASAIYTTTVIVNNTRPTAVVGTNATPTSLPSAPSIRVPPNTLVTLRGSGSHDPDGGTLFYAWSIVSAPATSTATLATPTQVNSQITPDLVGSYVIKLRVTDSAGAFSENSLIINIGNYPPVAVVDKNRVTVVAGSSIATSALLSYDLDSDPITYQWAVDVHPAGSTATIASPASANINFAPDLPGVYVLSVTVNDGQNSNVGYVTVRALSSLASSVALNFVPLDAKYSKGLDKLIITAANPNALKIVDPFSGAIQSVLLPLGVKSLQLSPDGKLAAVLHEGAVSLVDLSSAQIPHTSLTGGSQTDVFVQNDGVAYLIGQTGGQWVSPGVSIMDLRTGASIPGLGSTPGFAYFYGTQKGVFADKLNKVLFMAYGLSPSDISYFTVNPLTHAVTGAGESPYHGTWPLGMDFYLSGNQDLLFTSAGNFFHSDTLTYAGSLGTMSGSIISMSHSSQADELLLLTQTASVSYPYTYGYSAVYKRYSGALFLPDSDIALPLVGGLQSYGIKVFHSANEKHVMLVQTGSAQALAAGTQYYVIQR